MTKSKCYLRSVRNSLLFSYKFAVMFGRESKFKLNSGGEHSGRLSSVEVYSGATSEEILVPVIEFTLQGANVEVKISPKAKNEVRGNLIG